jgi:site-specific recombinase XerD
MVERDKANRGRKIILPIEPAALFKAQSKNKLPGALLFTRADGKPWNKDAWKGPIKEAALAAGLPSETTAYTLRHSTITDLVTGGLDLLTVAQVSGTSVRMIEKHYGHLQREHAKLALAKLAL